MKSVELRIALNTARLRCGGSTDSRSSPRRSVTNRLSEAAFSSCCSTGPGVAGFTYIPSYAGLHQQSTFLVTGVAAQHGWVDS